MRLNYALHEAACCANFARDGYELVSGGQRQHLLGYQVLPESRRPVDYDVRMVDLRLLGREASAMIL